MGKKLESEEILRWMRTGRSGDQRIDKKLASAMARSGAGLNVYAFLESLGVSPHDREVVIKGYMGERTDQASVQEELKDYK